MNPVIVVVGVEGNLGRYACRHFSRLGWEVVAVGRACESHAKDGMFLEWDGKSVGAWAMALEGSEAVLNLVGHEDVGARIDSTRVLGEAVAGCRVAPRAWLNASTVDWYGSIAGCDSDEWKGEPGDDAASRAALAWEDVFFGAEVPARTRKVAMRLGRVLVNEGMGMVGEPAGESWIHMEDFLRAVEFLLDDPFISGVVNMTAPWSHAGAQVGVRPLRLADEGFEWRWSRVAEALADLADRPGVEGFFKAMEMRPIEQGLGAPAGLC